MTTEVKVPASGESVTSANVARWHKQDGDAVRKGELLVTLETDKVSNELEAPDDGILSIQVAEGEEVPIGALIATLTPAGEAAEAPVPAQEAAPPPAPPAVSQTSQTSQTGQTSQTTDPTDPTDLTNPRQTRRKMSMLRRKIAVQLVNAQQSAAILTTFNEVDMSAVMALRKEVQEGFQQRHGVKLGLMSFFIKAVVQALKEQPSINAQVDGEDIVENHYYDIGVAISTEKGLVVPVVRAADEKSFARIEQDIADYAAKARAGKITLAELQGGVFTISNGGTYGSLLSTPILNPPQSGILGMHTIQQRPVALGGEVVIRPMMYLALSYDHRLVDGREAVGFLIAIKERLESPARMLVD